MLKDMSIRERLHMPDIFKGLRFRGEDDNARDPFDPTFIQNTLLPTAGKIVRTVETGATLGAR
jgi:hypothetical protein